MKMSANPTSTPNIKSGSSTACSATPEVARRIEESRAKAKVLRDQILDTAASESLPSRSTMPPVTTDDGPRSDRKRSYASISTSNIPSTSRDARDADGVGIQPVRKFKKYVDHDLSKMTDTKGGFLTAEDDPWNKALHLQNERDGGDQKPAHMTLREWERHQLLKGLRDRKEGPFEPGLSVLAKKGASCKECGNVEIDWQWQDIFKCAVCHRCKEKFPEKYSLLTKTEAKDDYLLTDPELKDEELLPHLNKPNPHKSHWHDMMLFLRYQVEEYAFNTKWGSAEALDVEFEKREAEKKKRKEIKFKSKLQELKKKTRTDAYRRNLKGGGGTGQFGDAVGSGRHEHDWGQTVENSDGATIKTCIECGMEVEELEF